VAEQEVDPDGEGKGGEGQHGWEVAGFWGGAKGLGAGWVRRVACVFDRKILVLRNLRLLRLS
jgi:hypothetical protein